jgi:DNA-binding ferritin-like protein
MRFDILDFFNEADDEEAKKKDEDKEEEKKEDKKDDDKDKEKDDELNDLLDDDSDSSKDDDSDKEDKKDDKASDDDELNDLIGDDDVDFTADDDEELSSDESSDDDINDIMGDSDSSSSGDDTEINALIISKGDGDDCCSGGVYEKIAKLGYMYIVISNNMKHIHLNACGRKFEEIHRNAEEFYYHFSNLADRFLEIAAESPLTKLDNVTRAKEHVEEIEVEDEQNYSFEKAMTRISDNFNKAIMMCKTVRECAGNARSDIQSVIDEELSYLNKQFGYILRKKLVPEETASEFAANAVAANESFSWLF